MKLQLKRSNVLVNSEAKAPTASQLDYGELAVNYNATDPTIFLKDSANNIVKVQNNNLQAVCDIGNTTTTGITAASLTTSGDITVNTDALFVDASTKQVGVGTASPSQSLEVKGSVKVTSPDGGSRYFFEAVDSLGSELSLYNSSDVQTTRISAHAADPTFFGTDVLIGGPSGSQATTLTAAGAATFSGNVVSGTDWNSGDGVSAYKDGFFYVRNDSETGVVFAIQNGGNGTGGHRKASITGDGAATFKGGVLTGDYDSGDSSTSGLSLQDTGRVIARRQTGSDVVWLGLHGSATGSEITAAGAATFAGALTLNGSGGSNAWMAYDGGTCKAQVTYDGTYRAGSISGANANILLTGSTGAASFAGTVTADGYSFSSLSTLP